MCIRQRSFDPAEVQVGNGCTEVRSFWSDHCENDQDDLPSGLQLKEMYVWILLAAHHDMVRPGLCANGFVPVGFACSISADRGGSDG